MAVTGNAIVVQRAIFSFVIHKLCSQSIRYMKMFLRCARNNLAFLLFFCLVVVATSLKGFVCPGVDLVSMCKFMKLFYRLRSAISRQLRMGMRTRRTWLFPRVGKLPWPRRRNRRLSLSFTLKLRLFWMIHSSSCAIIVLFSQARRGCQETARCLGSTTTSSVWETSGSWRRVGFSWRVEPTTVRDEIQGKRPC